ncbi:MAG: hypothetical protein M5U25_18375 [Planctomycetota bacterium]|nr:hypothetical protein [Planctomycetota bacterium]
MKRLLILFALGLLAACSNPDTRPDNQPACNPPENPPANQPEPEPEPEPEPAPTRGKLEDPKAPEQTRALDLIEKVTGMKFKVRPPVYVYTPEELAEEIKSWGDGGFTPENILGFYKFDTKAFYLVPEAAGNKRAFGLRIHEATHALQDQYYDLTKLHAVPTTTDGDYALLALIEGQAVQVMIDALIDEQPHVAFISKARAPEGSTDPNAYRSVYVYAQGTAFVQALKEVAGYKAVDAAFKDLPVSSEQVLHPEKYTGEKRELPDRIEPDLEALKAALPEGVCAGQAGQPGRVRDAAGVRPAGGDRGGIRTDRRGLGRRLDDRGKQGRAEAEPLDHHLGHGSRWRGIHGRAEASAGPPRMDAHRGGQTGDLRAARQP